MSNEIDKLVGLLRQSFEGGAWHGPSVMEVIGAITPEQAHARLPDTHSVIELVAHMTSWRVYVTRKLMGDTAYEVADHMNFPAVTDWHKTLEGIKQSQDDLIAALTGTPVSTLDAQVPGRERPLTFYTMVHGVIDHDLYHTGQIKLILKATSMQSL